MPATVRDILALVERQAPPTLAASWDRVGLQIGSPQQVVTRLVVALEATLPVLQEVVRAGAQMLLTHHPLVFQPLAQFNPDNPLHRPIIFAIRHDLAVAAAHTNLDAAHDGLNAYLAQVLGLEDTEPLEVTSTVPWLKLTVFVPIGYEDRVREALCQAGAGIIGNYAYCSFQVRGQGTYLPQTGARPWQGKLLELNRADESRLEVLLPQDKVAEAVAQLKAVHPYEEVAFDLYPLATPGKTFGFGRIGKWPTPRSWPEVVEALKQGFKTERLRVIGQPRATIQRVAICGGSGGDLIPQAWEKGAELYLTGDIRYHQAVPWAQEQMAIVDLGHFATEAIFLPTWGQRLQADLERAKLAVAVIVSQADADPCRTV
jgi:dinuclear metal center YbgI/SA1388 family protein